VFVVDRCRLEVEPIFVAAITVVRDSISVDVHGDDDDDVDDDDGTGDDVDDDSSQLSSAIESLDVIVHGGADEDVFSCVNCAVNCEVIDVHGIFDAADESFAVFDPGDRFVHGWNDDVPYDVFC